MVRFADSTDLHSENKTILNFSPLKKQNYNTVQLKGVASFVLGLGSTTQGWDVQSTIKLIQDLGEL